MQNYITFADRGIFAAFPAGTKDVYVLPKPPHQVRGALSLYSVGPGASATGSKRPGHEADGLLRSSYCSYTFIARSWTILHNENQQLTA